MTYFEISIVFLFFVIFYYFFREKNGLPTNWPFLGMLPALLTNIHRIHSFVIEILEKSHMSFHLKGPWFTNMHLLVTTDPLNVQHVMSKNFNNYPKGAKLHEMIDVFGDGIVNTDLVLWQYHRKMAHSFLNHPNFHDLLVNVIWDKVDHALFPILDKFSNNATTIDLQDLFSRFMSDTICIIIMDYDPNFLSMIELPSNPTSNALDDVEEAIFYRHVVPTWVWKFQRWLDVGSENNYRKAWETLDSFIYRCISMKRRELSKEKLYQNSENNRKLPDLLTTYIQDNEAQKSEVINNLGDKLLRDMILSMLIAGRDTMTVTLSWFFYLLSKNPLILCKIKDELDGIKVNRSNFREVKNKLVYLHATLCETLRLYPAVAFEAKTPIESDQLPSGHFVYPSTQIIFDLYAMGRMKSIWGDDCYQFRPERWISEQGKIRHEPSYKFFAFNSGPRTCLGKEMAFTQMKIVAATIIQNYVLEVMNEDQIVPDNSFILHMKFGFKVRVSCCQCL